MNKAVMKKCLFTISVALNLFLLGVIGGHVARVSGEVGDIEKPSWKEERLSPDTRKLMHETFVNKKGEFQDILKSVRDKRIALKDIIVAEDFDSEAYDAIAQEVVDLGSDVSMHKLETFKGMMEKLSREERQKVVHVFLKKIISSEGPRGAGHFRGGRHVRPLDRDNDRNHNK